MLFPSCFTSHTIVTEEVSLSHFSFTALYYGTPHNLFSLKVKYQMQAFLKYFSLNIVLKAFFLIWYHKY